MAAVAPASPSGAKAEYDAAALLLQRRQWTAAAAVLERFRAAYPQHELQPQVTRKLAVAYLESGRQHDAAVELERVAARERRRRGGAPHARCGRRPSCTWRPMTPHLPAAPTRTTSSASRRPWSLRSRRGRNLPISRRRPATPASRKRWLEELVAADAMRRGALRPHAVPRGAGVARTRAAARSVCARSIRLAIAARPFACREEAAMEASLSAYGRAAGYGVAEVTTAAALRDGRSLPRPRQVRCLRPTARPACQPRNSSSTTCCSRSRPIRSRRRPSASTRRNASRAARRDLRRVGARTAMRRSPR